MQVSAKAYIQEAYRMIVDGGWITGSLYGSGNAARQRELTQVCSVGAMRLSFRRLFNVPEDVDDEDLIHLSAYAEGMRLLGKAVYELEAEVMRERGSERTEWLLNGDAINPDTGDPFTYEYVEAGVIEWNDKVVPDSEPLGSGRRERIERAFKRAIDDAPESEMLEVPDGTWSPVMGAV